MQGGHLLNGHKDSLVIFYFPWCSSHFTIDQGSIESISVLNDTEKEEMHSDKETIIKRGWHTPMVLVFMVLVSILLNLPKLNILQKMC